ncbi:MAG: ArgR family transcriptional regulator [Oscillospiraceae bacterium]|nr:ArgR family transcriptional regulator [Oscillospiraceae bacterium]
MEKSDKMCESRYDAIIKIVSEQKISNQEVLLERLKELGYKATQSTVSRDIKRLGIIKASDDEGVVRYMTSSVNFTDQSIFKVAIKGADYAGHTAVIKCRTGTAQAVCALLDTMDCPDIVGTLAGDDTIFVLMRTENDAKHLVKKFRKELQLND